MTCASDRAGRGLKIGGELVSKSRESVDNELEVGSIVDDAVLHLIASCAQGGFRKHVIHEVASNVADGFRGRGGTAVVGLPDVEEAHKGRLDIVGEKLSVE